MPLAAIPMAARGFFVGVAIAIAGPRCNYSKTKRIHYACLTVPAVFSAAINCVWVDAR